MKKRAIGMVACLLMVQGAAASASEEVAGAGKAEAGAADPAAASEQTLDAMTISSSKAEDIHARTELGVLTEHTPISGTVVTQEELEHLQLGNNLLELGKRVPGISMIRNMRIPDGGKLYTENRIDGMRSTATNTSVLDEIDQADIERIEVITGPASALYGSGAFGGTISVFTRQPPKDLTFKPSQEFGSYGFKRTKFYAGDTFADGRLGVVLTGSSLDFDGWRKNTAPANNNPAEEHKDGFGLRTIFKPTDSTKVTLGLNYLKYNYRWAGPIPLTAAATSGFNANAFNGTRVKDVYFDNDWRQTVPGTYGEYDDEYRTASFRLQQLVGDRGEFTFARTRISLNELNNGNGGSGGANNVICDDGTTGGTALTGDVIAAGKTVRCSAANNGVFSAGKWSNATVTNTIKQNDAVTETTLAMYRQEFDLAKSTAYVGWESIDILSDSKTWGNAFNALQAQSGMWARSTISSAGNRTKTQESTPFVHFEFSPFDKLRLHFGERFGVIEYDVDDRTAANKDVNKMTRRGQVHRLGATYDWAPGHLVWANLGETFNPQSPGSLSNSLAVNQAGNVIGRPLSPERGITREIGFRGTFDRLGLKYDVTLFDADSNGFLVTRDCLTSEAAAFNGGLACTIQDSAGQLSTRGVESMFRWAATSWLDVGATYTNSRVWFTDYKTAGVGGFDYSGRDYQAAPRQKLNLRLGFKPAPGWLVELEGDHIASYYVDNKNTGGTYSRPDLFNLRASYRNDKWSVWMHALNLTDREYATRVQLSTVAGKQVMAAQAGQGNAGSYTPLTIRVGVSYDF